MDGSAQDHSDSDSGESWTLLESCPAHAEDAPDFAEHPPKDEGLSNDIADKDEDTDGISIISDSEPESSTPCELSYDQCLLDETRPAEPQLPKLISANPVPPNKQNHHESIRDDDDILGDNNGKLKTYVHRRNKRLSTMLNIIVLGSVITAAGVALGHMWGIRNDCSLNAGPSVNKILSNLYKLQEENAYLRNKLKELTLANNYHMQNRKTETEKPPVKQHKCRKLFEEPLNNKNVDKLTKCVDNESEKPLDSHLMDYEKEFLSDIDKLKNIYQQNKSWLDEEIAKRIKSEEQHVNKIRANYLKSPKSIKLNRADKTHKDQKLKGEPPTETFLNEEIINVTEPSNQSLDGLQKGIIPERKITYADSLKSSHKVVKRDINEVNSEKYKIKEFMKKKKPPKQYDTISEISSDDELKKDDRYVPQKFKLERKKNDRHKIHKKQKRRNKYEQWEMKGGYMKDYDDFSIPSSYENEYVLKKSDRNHLSKEFERNNYINQFAEPVDLKKDAVVEAKIKETRTGKDKAKEKAQNWYEKRAALRSEARKKLEVELFGAEAGSSAARGAAAWYFRRMQRREQCRAAADNSTNRRLQARLNNFKTKH